MKFTIPCEVFARLATVATSLVADRDSDYFRSVYLENKSGKSFAITTNIKFASIEYLGETKESDGSINIDCHDAILAQCEVERGLKGVLHIDYMPELRFASVKSTFGFTHSQNAAVFTATDNPAFERWRNWLPDKLPCGSDSPMFVDAEQLHALAKSSPSGAILFPQFTSKVVVVRDAYSDNWIGAFLGSGTLQDGRILKEIPVRMPDWVK